MSEQTYDLIVFREWLNLNLSSIAWEGKHRNSFEDFWQTLFRENSSLKDVAERLRLSKKMAKTGPLYSWINWLNDHFLIFVFTKTDLTISQLASETGVTESYLGFILRDYFLQLYPLKEDEINNCFELGAVFSPGKYCNCKEITTRLDIHDLPAIIDDEDNMMRNMEVTLFPEWNDLIRELKKDLHNLRISIDKVTKKISHKRYLKFIREFILLTLVGLTVIYGLRQVNYWYESFLVDKIKLLEPIFISLDQSLTYQSDDRAQRIVELSNKEIDELEKLETQKTIEEVGRATRFDPESDEVVLTSVEAIPKDFTEAEVDKDVKFDEKNKANFRDSGPRNGSRKSYRILTTSVLPSEMKQKILPLLEKYKVSKVVAENEAGSTIPGGIYFDLYVPSPVLKEFITEISAYSDPTIFESNSTEAPPAGKNRVFIWIKSI